MSGAYTHNKGRRGQLEARRLLQSRDWVVAELNSGTACEDVIATAPCGTVYAIEVKNTAAITTAHRKQAIEQAKERKAAWMLMSKIAGTSEWLIQRQHQSAVVWS